MINSLHTDRPSNVGIIIPTYGQWEYVQLAAESASRTPGAVIIIVDDGSPTWPDERIVSGWVADGVPYVIQRYFGNQRNLSRSWNTGIEIARGLGCRYIVCGNSDLVFPSRWWGPIRAALDDGADFVGPVTNAPGHVRRQDVTRYLPTYELSDDPDDIDQTQRALLDTEASAIAIERLNGFCFAGSMTSFDRLGKRPFDERVPMLGNEDHFFHRANRDYHAAMRIVTNSFVFHYRSVSLGLESGRTSHGAVRIPGCGGCANGSSRPLPRAFAP